MTISFLHTWADFAYCTYIKMIMFSYMQNPSQMFLQPGRYGPVKSVKSLRSAENAGIIQSSRILCKE